MEVVTVEEGTSEEDNSTNIQPIRTKQKATTRSRGNEQVVTVNLIAFSTSEPFVFSCKRSNVESTSYDM